MADGGRRGGGTETDSDFHPQQVTTAFTISKSPAAGEIEKVAGSNNISPEKSSGGTTNNGSASHQSHISDVSRAEILKRDVSANPK